MATNATVVPVVQDDKYTLRDLLRVISPLRAISPTVLVWLFAGTVGVLLLTWVLSPWALLPTPPEVFRSLRDLLADGLISQLVTSYTLNLEAIGVSIVFSLVLSYLTVIPIFRPIVTMSTALRFLSMVGLGLVFELLFPSKHTIKVAMLTFSISVWFVTSMLDVIRSIPKEQFDLARTIRMGQWRIVWEVVVLGQIDKVFDVLRQTAAMGWMMLTFVETVALSEGGIGTVLQTMQHHARFADIMAIQICIAMMGAGQDYGIGVLKGMFCPYASLTVEKN